MGVFSSGSNHTCPSHDLSENATDPFIGSWSFYHFNMVLSGSCAAIATITSFVLMYLHATHLSKPSEQFKIMKICMMVPLYSVFSFLEVAIPSAYVSIEPWLDYFQAVALGSFFLLMCEFVAPSTQERDVFFAALRIPDKKAPGGVGGGLEWFRKRWIMIFQYPVIALGVAIATDITQAAGIYCYYSSEPYFAHLWLDLLDSISVSIAVTSVLRFYQALAKHTANHRPLAKLIAFKLIVFLVFLQGIIFWILRDTNVLKPTNKMTYADLNIGLPTLIICIEMVPLSIFFHYAYTWHPYVINGPQWSMSEAGADKQYTPSYQGGPLGARAWFACINPSEVFRAIVFAFKMATENKRSGGQSSIPPVRGQYMMVGGNEPHEQNGYYAER